MNAQVISFRCTLRSRTGQFISSSISHDVLTSAQAGESLPLPGLARGLQGLKKGELRHIRIAAPEAYGYYDLEKVIEVPRRLLPPDTKLKLGKMITIMADHQKPHAYRVVRLAEDVVELDGNHPLAGQDLDFEIEALEVRDATADEIIEANAPDVRADLH